MRAVSSQSARCRAAGHFKTPAFAGVRSGHVGWMVGGEATVGIQVDFEKRTAARFALHARHEHG
jgi:hypothetical protein